jgi:FkbM family methyltransferase
MGGSPLLRAKHVLQRARPFVRRRGWDVVRYPGRDFAHARSRMLRHLGIDLVLDVGANVGQYGRLLRSHGYGAQILSFEPMSREYAELARTAAADGNWRTVRSALGSESAELEIHIAGNSISSSLLPMLDRHTQVAPRSAYVGSEKVPCARLDSLVAQELQKAHAAYLKVDTQGFEAQVLEGAAGVIDELAGVELEMSLTPLYGGQELFPDMLARMAAHGFRLATVAPGLFDRENGETLQVDGIFIRS